MSIAYTVLPFVDEEQIISFSKEFGPSKSLSCHIVLDTKKFLDYQKDLLQDFLSVLADRLSDEEMTYLTFKSHFEKDLQDLNNKLSVFAEKIKDVDRFTIKGVVQIFFDYSYVASMVGKVSVTIFRDEKLNYSLSNYIQENAKIDLFTEFVEGELEEDDEIIALGVPVDTYLDKDDFATVVQMHKVEDSTSLSDALIEVLQTRMSKEEIGFVVASRVETDARFSQKKIKKQVNKQMSRFFKMGGVWEKYRSVGSYVGIGVAVVILMYLLIQSFLSANQATFVDREGGVVIDFTIDDIQKDIALFKKIDPSSDEKIKKYNEIIEQLDLLESNNRWTYDVAELREILEAEYYKGFNIILVNSDEFFQDQAYVFTQQEQNTFGEPAQVFYTNALQVAGTEGILLGAINDTVRGTLISAGVDTTMKTCSLNLLQNGLYCVSDEDEIFNVTKSGLQPVSNTAGSFPTEITNIATYQSSNMYVMTEDPTLAEERTPIVRYTNQIGSQEDFGEGTEYVIDQVDIEEYPALAGGFSDFAIDGTFLTWSEEDQALYQLWREGVSNTLFARQISLAGGDTAGDQYGSDVQVTASPTSRLVYLFDPEHQTFTVYRSTPYKTNDANTTNYSLTYFFRIKFSLPDTDIVDAYVQEGEKSILYLLTNEGVQSVKLHDFIDTFYEKEANAE